MDPAELTDSRPSDAPLAIWRKMIVASVHHDGTDAMSKEWKIMTDCLVYDVLFHIVDTPPSLMTPAAEHWFTQTRNQTLATKH